VQNCIPYATSPQAVIDDARFLTYHEEATHEENEGENGNDKPRFLVSLDDVAHYCVPNCTSQQAHSTEKQSIVHLQSKQ
jgi:hypothetical protein